MTGDQGCAHDNQDPIARFIFGLVAVAQTNEHVAAALAPVGNLLINPMELAADTEVNEAVGASLAATRPLDTSLIVAQRGSRALAFCRDYRSLNRAGPRRE